MATMRSIKKRFGGEICRRCLNEVYGLNLSPNDCLYTSYSPAVCPCCGEVNNIVNRVRKVQRLVLLFKE